MRGRYSEGVVYLSKLLLHTITLDKIFESEVRRACGIFSFRSVNHLNSEEFVATRIVVRRGIRIVDSRALVGAEIVGIQPSRGHFVQAVICLILDGKNFIDAHSR